MAEVPRAGERFGTQHRATSTSTGSTSRRVRSGSGPAATEYRGETRHRRDRRVAPCGSASRARSGSAAAACRACATCDGFFFRDKRDRRGRRRRHRARGGDVPHPVRVARSTCSTAATSSGRSKIMLDRALDNPKIEVHTGTPRSTRSWATRRSTGLRLRDTRDRRGARRCRSTACSSRSATSPNTDVFRELARRRREGLPRRPRRTRAAEGRRASSSPATCTTTATARRSPRPATAARRRSTPSAGSRRGDRGALDRDRLVGRVSRRFSAAPSTPSAWSVRTLACPRVQSTTSTPDPPAPGRRPPAPVQRPSPVGSRPPLARSRPRQARRRRSAALGARAGRRAVVVPVRRPRSVEAPDARAARSGGCARPVPSRTRPRDPSSRGGRGGGPGRAAETRERAAGSTTR